MGNALENKSKFFALYWGQNVMRCKTFNATTGHGLSGLMNVDINSETVRENWFLELKPLSSISDEDAFNIGYGNRNSFLAINTEKYIYHANFVDYLRSRGYALPYLGLSVEEQVNRGWVKLKGETK